MTGIHALHLKEMRHSEKHVLLNQDQHSRQLYVSCRISAGEECPFVTVQLNILVNAKNSTPIRGVLEILSGHKKLIGIIYICGFN
jgi:hypothetical protein